MKINVIKKLDKHIQEIQYPFGINYPVFHKLIKDTAEQYNVPIAEVIKQYAVWKLSMINNTVR